MCWGLRLLVEKGRIRENLWCTNSFNPLFLHSAEKPEWGSALVWGCDYLIYWIKRKYLQVCRGTCGQNGTQLGIAMEGEVQNSIRLSQSKSFMLLLVSWVGSPSNRLLPDLVKPYISHDTSLGQCCEVISIYPMNFSILCWGACCFPIPYHNERRKSLGQEVEGEITLSLFSFSIPCAGP